MTNHIITSDGFCIYYKLPNNKRRKAEVVMSNAFFGSPDVLGVKVCEALGIDPDLVQRIVIDIDACRVGPLPVYVQMIGTDKLLNIDWSFDGVDIDLIDSRPKAEATKISPQITITTNAVSPTTGRFPMHRGVKHSED